MLGMVASALMLADVLFLYKCTGYETTVVDRTVVSNECSCYRSNQPVTNATIAWSASLAYLTKHEPTYSSTVTWHQVSPWIADMISGGVTNSVTIGYHCEYKCSAKDPRRIKSVDFCHGDRRYVCDVRDPDGEGLYGVARRYIIADTVLFVFTNALHVVTASEAAQMITADPTNCVSYSAAGFSGNTLPKFSNPRLGTVVLQSPSPSILQRNWKKVKSYLGR